MIRMLQSARHQNDEVRRKKGSRTDFIRRLRPAPLPRIEDLPPARSERHLSGGMPCEFGPAAVAWSCQAVGNHIAALVASADGAFERYCADLAEDSHSVPCDGDGVVLVGFTFPPTRRIACLRHHDWLRRHELLNGLDSGVEARRSNP